MAIGDNYHRLRIMMEIKSARPTVVFEPLVHPSCVVAFDVVLGEGTVVMPGAVLMAGCRLGPGCLVNTSASLDHEGSLGEGASLAPDVITGGCVSVGRRAFIGIGSTFTQGLRIDDDSVVGAGSLVLDDVPKNAIVYGRPAKFIRSRRADEPYF
jgi:sugar O-acyltransferase (sialic acid O-acetyltransferase NeuD family)